MQDGSYALLFTSCANANNCVPGSPGGVYLATSPNGVTGWSTPVRVLDIMAVNVPIDPVNTGHLTDLAAPRVINYNGTWFLYVQGTARSGVNNSIYVASGTSLNSLQWQPNPIVKINPLIDVANGKGIGEFHQWFNSAPYGGYPGSSIVGFYNDWSHEPNPFYFDEYSVLSTNGTSSVDYYGPVSPVVASTSGKYTILYPDVMLSGSLDAALYGDFGLTLGDGCYLGQRAYRPIVGLGFYNAPYRYRDGVNFNLTPIATFKTNPLYSDAVIETTGTNNNGFRPRFARNQYGYLDPVAGSNPRQWQTYVYYTSSLIGADSDSECDYTKYATVPVAVGVSQVTITEQ